jgi:hypothetical protein
MPYPYILIYCYNVENGLFNFRCGHCKSLAPEWTKAANALNGIVNIGAVDMTTDQVIKTQYYYCK